MYMFKTKGDWGDTYGSLDPNILINELSTSLKEQRDSDCIEKILDRIVKCSHNVMRCEELILNKEFLYFAAEILSQDLEVKFDHEIHSMQTTIDRIIKIVYQCTSLDNCKNMNEFLVNCKINGIAEKVVYLICWSIQSAFITIQEKDREEAIKDLYFFNGIIARGLAILCNLSLEDCAKFEIYIFDETLIELVCKYIGCIYKCCKGMEDCSIEFVFDSVLLLFYLIGESKAIKLSSRLNQKL